MLESQNSYKGLTEKLLLKFINNTKQRKSVQEPVQE